MKKNKDTDKEYELADADMKLVEMRSANKRLKIKSFLLVLFITVLFYFSITEIIKERDSLLEENELLKQEMSIYSEIVGRRDLCNNPPPGLFEGEAGSNIKEQCELLIRITE